VTEPGKTRNFLQAATMKEFCFEYKAFISNNKNKDMNVETLGRSISCESCASGVCLGGKSNGYLKMMGTGSMLSLSLNTVININDPALE